MTADGFRLLARLALGGLFVGTTQFHLAKDTLALHLLLQRLEGLVDIVVANGYVNDGTSPVSLAKRNGSGPAGKRVEAAYITANLACEAPNRVAGHAIFPAVLYRRRRSSHISVMAILKIAKMGHPVLRRRAAPVPDPTAPEIRRLVEDMIETMEDADGAGLAAPQVHVPLRVVIFHVPRGRDEDNDEPVPLTVLINPVVEPLTEEMAGGWEGCLSVPGMVGTVPRYTRVRYSGVGPDGGRIDRTAEGFHARVVQHECDHLDGILYPQRMDDLSMLMFRDQLRYHGGAVEAEAELEEE